MALFWSWAFGQETSLLLEEEMGWQFETTSPSFTAPSNNFIYSFSGDAQAGNRISMAMDDQFGNRFFRPPTSAFVPEGWLTTAVYVDGGFSSSNSPSVMNVRGALTSRLIGVAMKDAATETFSLFVNNVEKATWTMTPNDWHYIALQYNMTGNPWTATVYVDGVDVTTQQSETEPISEADGVYEFQGHGLGARSTYFAQIIVFDEGTGSVGQEPGQMPRFVTRLPVGTDLSDVGSWAPGSAGSAQSNEIATNPFSNLSATVNAGPINPGDNVITDFNTSLGVMLGNTGSVIDGVTVHSYSSGTNINVHAACGANGTPDFTDGATYTPDLNDTTYGFATAVDTIVFNVPQPWNQNDVPNLKFEID
jgi:hypothetical protein